MEKHTGRSQHSCQDALQEVKFSQQTIEITNDISYKVLVILIHAHLANLGKPETYVKEVKKGLRGAS